ncbi:aryl-sulfate sulfotransferase, partial [bacterium]|nr:aryl-sulfate sulfotransferase [bacterium]
ALSVREFNEVWIIDHSTTTEQAKGSSGGRWGRGGDLLYRWGNPATYKQGTVIAQQLFSQHDAQWLADGASLLLFNNGRKRPGEDYSSVIQIELPVNQGEYQKIEGKAFVPAKPSWEYSAANKADFFSSFLSGAQRLPNGNTLICHGMNGSIFEVTNRGETVWKYILPLPNAELVTPGMHGYRMGLFTVRRYAPDDSAFEGKVLTPGVLLESVLGN